MLVDLSGDAFLWLRQAITIAAGALVQSATNHKLQKFPVVWMRGMVRRSLGTAGPFDNVTYPGNSPSEFVDEAEEILGEFAQTPPGVRSPSRLPRRTVHRDPGHQGQDPVPDLRLGIPGSHGAAQARHPQRTSRVAGSAGPERERIHAQLHVAGRERGQGDRPARVVRRVSPSGRPYGVASPRTNQRLTAFAA